SRTNRLTRTVNKASTSRAESIPLAADCHHHHGMGWIVLELDPQALGEGPEIVALVGVLRPPDALEQGAMVERHPGVPGKLGEKQPFGRREPHFGAGAGHRTRAEVDPNTAVHDDPACTVRRTDAAQHGPNPGKQFVCAKRLGEVVVSPEVEGANLV